MALEHRQDLLEKISDLRGRPAVALVISLRENINIQLDPGEVRVFRRALEEIGSVDELDVFLITYGGTSTVPWQLACLIREFAKEFAVLVPYPAMSAGTSLAIGADEIIMGKLGTLGPVDPKVANEFNPRAGNQPVGISVEDVSSYYDLLKDQFKIEEPNLLVHLLSKMPEQLHPLALGNVYRHYQKAREDTRRLLEMHMDGGDKKLDPLVEALVSGMKFHGHPITRRQAKELGLKVLDAEAVAADDATLDSLMWALYQAYEEDMEWMTPYSDAPPAAGGEVRLLVKAVETKGLSCRQEVVQNWRRLQLPDGSVLTQANNQPAAWIPPNQVVPLMPRGNVIQTEAGIYEKQERLVWEGYRDDP